MRKNILSVLLLVVLLPMNGCAMSIINPLYMSIDFDNVSDQKINNIRCYWVNYGLYESQLYPGQGASQSFALKNNNVKSFYGTVRITWENAAGKQFEKTFQFTENDLPPEKILAKKEAIKDYSDLSKLVFVQFEFNQEGVYFYTSNTPGAWEHAKKMGKIQNEIQSEYRRKKREGLVN